MNGYYSLYLPSYILCTKKIPKDWCHCFVFSHSFQDVRSHIARDTESRSIFEQHILVLNFGQEKKPYVILSDNLEWTTCSL